MHNEATIRLVFFVTIFLVCFFLERIYPLRNSVSQNSCRRLHNYLFLVAGIVITRIFPPLVAIGAAVFAERDKIGVMHWIDFPLMFSFVVCLFLFDLTLYLQHIAMHKVPFLWRYHSVHHSDEKVDLTTGFRFHPGELLFSLCYKWLIIVFLGASPLMVIVYESLLSAFSLITHSNIKISEQPKRIISKVFITPDLHWLHHSIDFFESNRNFGTIFSFWDKIFHTYQGCSNVKAKDLTFGVDKMGAEDKRFIGLIRYPFT